MDKIVGQHQRQALNYLLFMGMNHGKLINMRPESVEYNFVSTRLTSEKRYNFIPDTDNWNDLDEDSACLKGLVLNLLFEWGGFLETNLFYSAVCYFHGGDEYVVKQIPITNIWV